MRSDKMRMNLGLVRVTVASPELRVGDVAFNAASTLAAMTAAAAQGSRVIVFPEMGLTSYSCGDLYRQPALIDAARAALRSIAEATRDLGVTVCVGLPWLAEGRLYNAAALLSGGRVLGLVPKQYLPNRSEFYDDRYFARGGLAAAGEVALWDGLSTAWGTDLLFGATDVPGCVIGIEICEDLWAVQPPSGRQALAGATLLLNPSASPELLGKAGYRRELVGQQSARCIAAYLYAGSSAGESTKDVVYAGHSQNYENGTQLAETERFALDTRMAHADVDLQRLQHERLNNSSFGADATPSLRRVNFVLGEWAHARMLRPIARMPFVPADPTQRARNCAEVFNIQATGLAKRLKHTGVKRVAIGISGGLDSTLALLVVMRAFDKLGLDRAGVIAITMPGFGTTSRTKGNAHGLMQSLGVSAREISIVPGVTQHFADIGHPLDQHDITYENSQARERTQILMDVANREGGFVVGTGDLSEAALGWMTFNGDHMSMYHVNAGVPKTLVKYLIDWASDSEFSGESARILKDIVATPISPELLPLDKQGALQQKTEDTVGPYELHDFFLFHAVRYAYPPAKVMALALQAFDGAYEAATIWKWLDVFYRRFFSQQFKRSSMPDGPKVGSVALSPRGDWRMPSDMSVAVWKAELERIKP